MTGLKDALVTRDWTVAEGVPRTRTKAMEWYEMQRT